jgi:hypothetical protein
MLFICHAEGCQTKIPFVIMTSDDTNALTIKLLESNSYFGMEPSQVKILKQVPSVPLFYSCDSYGKNVAFIYAKHMAATFGVDCTFSSIFRKK